jgi:hypothetical protein
VNGSFPPGFDGALDGGGLSNVMPRTVGDTDGVTVPPSAGELVPPPTGGVVVPLPGGGVVGLTLAGHALLLELVVGKSVLAAKGTTMSVGSDGSGLGVADGTMGTLRDGLPSALALATRSMDALPARPALNANAAIAHRPDSSLEPPRMTQVIAHNRGRGCAQSRQASRSVALAASS